MRYYRVGRDEFLENGKAVVRLGGVLIMPSPVSRGRTVRVFEILQVLRENPKNPAPPRGAMIALSFPDEKVNGEGYVWGPVEESQVPYEITDRKANLEQLQRRTTRG